MNIMGCDLPSRYQVVAWVHEETGEVVTRRLEHENGEARKFYASLPRGTMVGIEATFPAHWFERLLGECGHELRVGHAAKIRASVVRRQKTGTRDAEPLLELWLANRFPRIWVASLAERDLRQLLVPRMKLVRMRTAVKNQLPALAISQGVCRKQKLWSVRGRAELDNLALLPWASRRRQDLIATLEQLNGSIGELDGAVEAAAQQREEAVRLMTHPGVGPVVGLAFVLTVGQVSRFPNSRHLVSYLGLNPSEHSRGGRQRLGAITKQGNTMLRWRLVEAAQTTARYDPELRRVYQRWKFRRASGVAKVAIARRLAVRLYWMLRAQVDCAQLVRMSGSPSSGVAPKPSESIV